MLQKRIAKLIGVESLADEKAEGAPSGPRRAAATPRCWGPGAIVTEYIRHSRLSPAVLLKLTRELRDACPPLTAVVAYLSTQAWHCVAARTGSLSRLIDAQPA
jgi:hypothetical protein